MAARRLVGKTAPRLWTPPQRKLTRATSHGYAVCDFADVIGEPFLPWQRWLAIHAMETDANGFYRFRVVLVLVGRQNGKALDLDTELLTSRGFVTMTDVREGDEVYHPDGHLVRVAGVSEVMHDHDCYRVTTVDGRSVIADGDHLWSVLDKRKHRSTGPRGSNVRWFEPVIMTTKEMTEAGISRCSTGSRTTVTSGKRYATQEYRFQLPAQQPLKSPDVPLPVDPYVLGAWLGDGHSSAATITSADPEIIEEIRKSGESCAKRAGHPYAWGLSDGIRTGPTGHKKATLQWRLRLLGVLGNKHVPDAYLTAGTTQREALLQGLLDTDGHIDGTRGQVEFCSTSRRLADSVLYLARSLGWRATLRTARATLYGKDCGPKYRVCFTPKTTDPFCPFRLPRKIARIRDLDGGKDRMTVSIASIEPVESRPVRCIQVDSPDGLFLAGRDLIPTHNSSVKRTISLWRLHIDGARLVLGVAQDVSLAREQWQMCLDTIKASPDLSEDLAQERRVNGDEWFRLREDLEARGIDPGEREISYEDDELDESLTLAGGGRYKIAASNRKAGRGLSVDELNIDELREQRSWAAWSALSKTTMARPDAQIWCMSNAGDDESVVLNQLREAALSGRDPSIGLFEWSGEDNCALDDWDQIRQANPGLGYTVSEAAIRTAITTDPPNVFRCLDVKTPVLTACGTMPIGKLQVGDAVKGTSGEWVDVTGASETYTGRDCYRVTLNDGRSIVCDAGHLWTVRDRRRPRPEFETLRTTELISRGITYRNPSMNYDVRNFSLPPVAPLDGPDVDLPVHPYLLGLWLGDGSRRSATLFVEDRDADHIAKRMEAAGATITTRAKDSAHCERLGFQIGHPGAFTTALRSLGIYPQVAFRKADAGDFRKFVPDVYLTGSLAQRLDLLRGLMDSDGTVTARAGRCCFVNTDAELIAGVRSLVRSLGWKTSELEAGQYGESHHLPRLSVDFTPRPGEPCPVTIPRKAERIRAARGSRDVRPVTIASIEPAPSVPVRCVQVDAPDSLFLAGDLVPTHNTEVLCQKVDQLDGAVDYEAWKACADAAGTMDGYRSRLAACLDIAPDGQHATLAVAAILSDGRPRVELAADWTTTAAVRAELPALLEKIKPKAFGWYPAGPAAEMATVLRPLALTYNKRPGKRDEDAFPEDGEIKGAAVSEVCQELSGLTRARALVQPGQDLLDTHIRGASRLYTGDGWRFTRKGEGHCDSAYAAAGAIRAAITMPKIKRPRMRTFSAA